MHYGKNFFFIYIDTNNTVKQRWINSTQLTLIHIWQWHNMTQHFNDEKPFIFACGCRHVDTVNFTSPSIINIMFLNKRTNKEKKNYTHSTHISHEIWKKILLNIQFTYISMLHYCLHSNLTRIYIYICAWILSLLVEMKSNSSMWSSL